MILSKSPLRVSFGGGGTDLPSFYHHNNGSVLSTAIDKFVYVGLRAGSELSNFRYLVRWSTNEVAESVDEIEHPIVREVIRYFDISGPLEVISSSDIPSNTGLGSSSAFTVGLINSCAKFTGRNMSKYELADLAQFIERERLKRCIGKQDHWASAFGGLNKFTFKQDETVSTEEIRIDKRRLDDLQEHLMFFSIGPARDASSFLVEQCKEYGRKMHVLRKMAMQADDLRQLLESNSDLNQFGELLHSGWLLKKSITTTISTPSIDTAYEKARSCGAIGGKLLGAGGGGFLLLFVQPIFKERVREALRQFIEIPVRFEATGSEVICFE